MFSKRAKELESLGSGNISSHLQMKMPLLVEAVVLLFGWGGPTMPSLVLIIIPSLGEFLKGLRTQGTGEKWEYMNCFINSSMRA